MPARRIATIPVNPRLLRWARDWSGRSAAEAARHVHVPVEKLTEWETPGSESAPSVRQARMLAKFYGRAFLEFFREEPPDLPPAPPVPDFRLYRGADDPAESRELRRIETWADVQRTNALDLYSELGESIPEIPVRLFSAIENDVEATAHAVRGELEFPIEDQINLTQQERQKLPSLLRRKIESRGVLTLRRPDLKLFGARGFCIASFPLPVIVFGTEAPSAQMFTLMHEFAHVLLRQSALTGSIPREGGNAHVRAVEEWCNRFAAAFLLPRQSIERYLIPPATPRDAIDDETIKSLARRFGMSEHATLIRLVHLHHVRAQFYWDVKRPVYLEQEEHFRSFGRAEYYGSRYRSAVGDLYTSLVLDAWDAGRITNHNAAEFMGISNLAHLNAIKEHFDT